MKDCELCNLEKKSEWHYEGKYFIICDCTTCKCPMIVLKRHDIDLEGEEKSEVANLIILHGIDKGLKPDWNRRKVRSHFHVHLR